MRAWSGRAVKMRQIFGLIKKIAPMDVSVIIQGETGTGKELVARAIHETRAGARRGRMVVLDCGAIPPNLIESELFGHEKGAFTGAVDGAAGRLRAGQRRHHLPRRARRAARSTCSPSCLRVLENREVRRVGGNDVIEVDVRVIAATNRDLVKEIAGGQLPRGSLLPPLRHQHPAAAAARSAATTFRSSSRGRWPSPEMRRASTAASASPRGACRVLMAYAWPGNVRELMNVLSHVLTFSEGEEIDVPEHLPARVRGQQREGPLPFNEHLTFKDAKEQLLENFEREYIDQRAHPLRGQHLPRGPRERPAPQVHRAAGEEVPARRQGR